MLDVTASDEFEALSARRLKGPGRPGCPFDWPPNQQSHILQKKAPWSLQNTMVKVGLKTGLAKKSGQGRMGPTAKGEILTVYLCETHRRSRQPGGAAPMGRPPASSVSATNTQNPTLPISNAALIASHATSTSPIRRRGLRP